MDRTRAPLPNRPAIARPAPPRPDLLRAIGTSWNRIRYFHVGRRHAYALPPRNDNPAEVQPDLAGGSRGSAEALEHKATSV